MLLTIRDDGTASLSAQQETYTVLFNMRGTIQRLCVLKFGVYCLCMLLLMFALQPCVSAATHVWPACPVTHVQTHRRRCGPCDAQQHAGTDSAAATAAAAATHNRKVRARFDYYHRCVIVCVCPCVAVSLVLCPPAARFARLWRVASLHDPAAAHSARTLARFIIIYSMCNISGLTADVG